jgi:anti-sigma-K factor RskA
MNGDINLLAAEYVIGTLGSDERAQAQALLRSDESFLAKVNLWERRLGELHLMVEPLEPDAHIWERIKGKMPEVRPAVKGTHSEATALEPDGQPAATLVPAESPMPGVETAVGPATEEPPPPQPDAIAVSGPEVQPIPAATPDPASAAMAAPDAAVAIRDAAVAAPRGNTAALAEARDQFSILSRRLNRWRALAALMLLLVAALVGLLAFWRFTPDRVPAALRPLELMRRMGIEVPPSPSTLPARRIDPRGSPFEE